MNAPPLTDPDEAETAASRVEPQLVLNVGVTGHRLKRLGDVDLDSVYDAVGTVLAAIERGATPCAGPALRMITSIAEGADSIAARAAIARHWTLDVVLPFAAGDYARDFAEGGPRDTFAEQCAAARAVLELPGERDCPGGAGVAYERAGRVVLTQCDLLVAIWDGGPLHGRGGAAQIVSEAVSLSIPVIQIDPQALDRPLLLWDGLEEHDLGQQTIETVPRGGIDALVPLVHKLACAPEGENDTGLADGDDPRWSIALAYPVFLGLFGVRRPRRSDFVRPRRDAPVRPPSVNLGFAGRIDAILRPRFARADAHAAHAAQLFRSGYVMNFSFAAIAVALSLLGLALPSGAKPVLVVLELAVIATILVVTRVGNRAAWHRRWLDGRNFAERLRCLGLSAAMGDLDLRAGGARTPPWVGWRIRATARDLGLPSVRIDDAYLKHVRGELTGLLDSQIAYLSAEAGRMHTLEHRLHRLGALLFGATAIICVVTLALKAAAGLRLGAGAEAIEHPLAIALTIGSAALPAIGAAIYGIRMQGDFAGIAERNEALAHHLASLREVIGADALTFDTLRRRVRRVNDLLTADLDSWLQTYHARPLALPG